MINALAVNTQIQSRAFGIALPFVKSDEGIARRVSGVARVVPAERLRVRHGAVAESLPMGTTGASATLPPLPRNTVPSVSICLGTVANA